MPIIPEAQRRCHHVFFTADHRSKAAARFLQALWREDHDLPIGAHVNRRDPKRATRFVTDLLPGTMIHVTDLLFEHSPGHGDPRLTADRTAYDIVLCGRDATGARVITCIEMEYSESSHEPPTGLLLKCSR